MSEYWKIRRRCTGTVHRTRDTDVRGRRNIDDHLCVLRPMTHAPETGAINRLHFSWHRVLWYVCRANPRPYSFFRVLKESSVRVAEMITCYWSMIIVVVSCLVKLLYAVMWLDAHGTKNRRWKWSRFTAPVSGACVMGLTSWRCIWKNVNCKRRGKTTNCRSRGSNL